MTTYRPDNSSTGIKTHIERQKGWRERTSPTEASLACQEPGKEVSRRVVCRQVVGQ
jgi:hypothetical protein